MRSPVSMIRRTMIANRRSPFVVDIRRWPRQPLFPVGQLAIVLASAFHHQTPTTRPDTTAESAVDRVCSM